MLFGPQKMERGSVTRSNCESDAAAAPRATVRLLAEKSDSAWNRRNARSGDSSS
jgi:hypothetical protein